MRIMTTDAKQLAEFAAEFLGRDKLRIALSGPAIKRKGGIDPKGFFDSEFSAPIIAHLAKREMEKRGFDWECSRWKGGYVHHYEYKFFTEIMPETREDLMDENEYIALWSAIESAMKNEKDKTD